MKIAIVTQSYKCHSPTSLPLYLVVIAKPFFVGHPTSLQRNSVSAESDVIPLN